MNFDIHFTPEAQEQYQALPEKKLKKVRKALGYLQKDPRHPSLNTHAYTGYSSPFNPTVSIFEAYVENKTSGAYRIFWCYGPDRGDITIIAITPHP